MKKWTAMMMGITVLLAAFRTVIVGAFTEADTGFYVSGSTVPVVFNICIFLAAAVFFIFYLRTKLLPAGKLDVSKLTGKEIAVSFWLLTAGLTVDFAANFFSLTKGTPDPFSVLLFFASAAAAFCGAILAILLVTGRTRFNRCYFVLIIAAWATINCICTFRGYRTISAIGEHLFDVLAAVAVMLFLFYLGRCFYGEKSAHQTAALGALAFLASALELIPRLYFRVAGNHDVFLLPFRSHDAVYAAMLLLVPVVLTALSGAGESEVSIVTDETVGVELEGQTDDQGVTEINEDKTEESK